MADLGLSAILESDAFRRLEAISFLGALDREHRFSRADHSLGTAALTDVMLRDTALETRRHGVAAALLHDIAQWALSHSCEGAFERLTGVSGKCILQAVLFDGALVDMRYHLGRILESVSIDPAAIWDILRDRRNGVTRLKATPWQQVAAIFQMPLNPDTLDGISRAAFIYGVPCPNVIKLAAGFRFEKLMLVAEAEALPQFDLFWTAKAKVYAQNIYSPQSLSVEVAASRLVLEQFTTMSFREAFELRDADLRAIVHAAAMADPRELDLGVLFRAPRQYTLHRRALRNHCIAATDLAARYRSEDAPGFQAPAAGTQLSIPMSRRYHSQDGNRQQQNSENHRTTPSGKRLSLPRKLLPAF